jgi:hypothetical protein
MAKQKGTESVDTLEQQVVAYAEQLGRFVGTVQAKAEGWLDPDALREQMSRVRDGATELLDRLRAGGGQAERREAGRQKGRSGGVVDAPGKKHRKPTPNVRPPRSTAADASRIAKMKAVQGNRRRGGR